MNALATCNRFGFNCFLFITPIIIIRFTSSLSQLTSSDNKDFGTFYKFRIGTRIPEIFNLIKRYDILNRHLKIYMLVFNVNGQNRFESI